MLRVESHQGLGLFHSVVFVALLDFFDLGLDPLKYALLAGTFMEKREKNKSDKQGEKDDRHSEIPESDGVIEKNQYIQQGLSQNCVE